MGFIPLFPKRPVRGNVGVVIYSLCIRGPFSTNQRSFTSFYGRLEFSNEAMCGIVDLDF